MAVNIPIKTNPGPVGIVCGGFIFTLISNIKGNGFDELFGGGGSFVFDFTAFGV
jgi:hypothetical protein